MIDSTLLGLAVKMVVAVAVLTGIGEFLIRVIFTPAARRAGVAEGHIRIFREAVRFLVFVLAVLAVIRIAGLTSDFTTLTASGIIAVAISLALQTTLTNVFSGVLLLWDNTIRINDTIQLSGLKGEIVKIGLRSCWIQTEDDHLVVVSNSQIASGPLLNYTAKERLMKKL